MHGAGAERDVLQYLVDLAGGESRFCVQIFPSLLLPILVLRCPKSSGQFNDPRRSAQGAGGF